MPNRCYGAKGYQTTVWTIRLLFVMTFQSVSSSCDWVRADDAQFFESKVRPLLVEHCYSCHSATSEKVRGGLRLDGADQLQAGSESGPVVVPGNAEESLLIHAIRYEASEMPPDGKLSAKEIEILVQWVNAGAYWPDDVTSQQPATGKGYNWDEFRQNHWAFRQVQKPHVPSVEEDQWPQNAIDAFVLRRLEVAGLRHNSAANPRELVRRLFLDLTGLPPTPSEVEQFVAESADDIQATTAAWIDRLLARPQYGERWGRHWLDIARFSDGLGGSTNPKANTEAWRYRDWVVNAINDDMPYNDFIRMQIAGDLLGDYNSAVATGFFALGPVYNSDGGDPDSIAQAKGETLDDRVDTLSRGILALTVSCARCHDHKFDPIPQQDYYSLAGIFANASIHDAPLAPRSMVDGWNQQHKAIIDLQNQIKQLDQRRNKERRDLTPEESSQRQQWQTELDGRKAELPPKYATAHALRDAGSDDMAVAIRGNLRKPGEIAPRRFLRIVAGDDRSEFKRGSGRLELADAVCSADNPLTARVIVNRVWMHHFGKALVRSPDNFGLYGESPTHPELLDWLAAEFVDSGWSLKWLHRLIMTSATWQQSSAVRESAVESDADNQWLWRTNPERMEAEVWRDSLLFVTNEIDLSIGGTPYDDPLKSPRRTLYAKVSRNGDQVAADAFLRLFDFPLMRATVAKRPTSIVPQQYLFMMNSPFMVDRARAFAARLEPSKDIDDRIFTAYQILFGRNPTKDEHQIGRRFLSDAGSQQAHDLPAMVQYAQVLLSSNEFMFVR